MTRPDDALPPARARDLPPSSGALIIVRHGETRWNAEHRFTGWGDPPLTERGRAEALAVGSALATARLIPDVIVTSLLRRATDSIDLIRQQLPTAPTAVTHWRLNERHYGALEGTYHEQAREQFGADQVERWRRRWDERPPPMPRDDPRHPRHDQRYAHIPADDLPDTESLADCLARQLPYFADGDVTPLVQAGARVLLVGHGNALRSLVAYLEDVPPQRVPALLIPTGEPQMFTLTDRWRRHPLSLALRGTVSGP